MVANPKRFEERLRKLEGQTTDQWDWILAIAVCVLFASWRLQGGLVAPTPQSPTAEQTSPASEFKPSKDAPKFRYPFSSKVAISSGYGMRTHPVTGGQKMHSGVDLPHPTGTPILAVADGKVESAGDLGGCGTGIRINHSGGYMSVYCHNSKNYVRVGQSVKAGDTIGLVGSTGLSTGPHLHLGIKLNGEWIDPKKVVPLD